LEKKKPDEMEMAEKKTQKSQKEKKAEKSSLILDSFSKYKVKIFHRYINILDKTFLK